MQHPVRTPRKLIEVALPLDAINIASAREKSIRHGHPSTLHLWWARRPLAAARAVIFAQMVNDPSWKWEMDHSGEIPPNNLKASWGASRKRLFGVMEDLVKWESTTNEEVLDKARAEIRKSWRETCEVNNDHPHAAELFNPDKLPAFHDPFAGGGALPLEAQRLGLEAHASDLNPVAVLINKAMIEIPPRFSGKSPINPDVTISPDLIGSQWKGSQGLAEDVRYYGQWIRDEAHKRIGHLYLPVTVTSDMVIEQPNLKPYVGKDLTVIAWIWARTVSSPNPAFSHVHVPLASSFVLSSKSGNEIWVEPVITGDQYAFCIRHGVPADSLTLGTRAGKAEAFMCILSKTPIPRGYIQAEGKAGRLGRRLMAVVVETPDGRTIVSPPTDVAHCGNTLSDNASVTEARVSVLSGATPTRAMITGGVCSAYGLKTWGDLFTSRQIVALTTFSDLVTDVTSKVLEDCGRSDGKLPSEEDVAYAEAIATYLAFGVSRAADFWSSGATWESSGGFVSHVFTKQALPMVWDYAESNPFSAGTGNWSQTCMDWIIRVIRNFAPSGVGGVSTQAAAQEQSLSTHKVVSTDPPYFNNISYAVLADYFYAWLRRSLRPIYPDLFATVSTPKAEELVTSPARHDSKEAAESFFLDGMTEALRNLARTAHPAFPVTIYYAYKQAETGDVGTSSAGWERFLEATLTAGFAIAGTWPMRTERANRSVGIKKNALASSIILVCHPRPATAATTSKRAFQRELNEVLPKALAEMTRGAGDDRSPVAPVDLSQAIIGPGMAVFSKYSAVLEADGTSMSVKTALQLINRFLAEDNFDHDTQFCLHWFEQHGWKEGKFGDADTLARAKGTSVEGVKQAGVLHSAAGVVRLLRWADYPAVWDPTTDVRLPVWEALHQIIRVFDTEGERAAGIVLAAIQDKAEATRQLAYRLYTLCERAGWAEDARAYNEIITGWSAIESAAAAAPMPQQATLFG